MWGYFGKRGMASRFLRFGADEPWRSALLAHHVATHQGELGTVRQTLSWFLEHGLALPARSVSGEITWRRPSYGVLYRMLTNPNHGGAYAYGKTEHTLQYDHGE